jgi:hypothetical protein
MKNAEGGMIIGAALAGPRFVKKPRLAMEKSEGTQR